MQKFLRHGRCQPTWVSPSPSGKLISHGSKDSTFPVGQLSTLLAQSCQPQRKKSLCFQSLGRNVHTPSCLLLLQQTTGDCLSGTFIGCGIPDLGFVGHHSGPMLVCFNPPVTTAGMWLNPSSRQTLTASHLWSPYSSLNLTSPSWAGNADIIKNSSIIQTISF